MSKQELKHDELGDVFDRLTLWYHRNSGWVVWLVLVVLLAFVGSRLYGFYKQASDARATAELGKVQVSLSEALSEKNEQKRKELFATAIADADRLSQTLSGFHQRQALLLLGNAHYYYSLALANQKSEAAEERKLARQAFEKLNGLAKTPEEKATASLALANVLENELFATRDLALLKQAADYYTDVTKLVPDSYLAAEARLALARMYQPVSDKRDEAERALAQVIESRSKASAATSENAENQGNSKASRPKYIDPEVAQDLRDFAQLSYVAEAKRLLSSLKGFEPAKQQ